MSPIITLNIIALKTKERFMIKQLRKVVNESILNTSPTDVMKCNLKIKNHGKRLLDVQRQIESVNNANNTISINAF